MAELIGNATRRAFETIIDLCLTERVDALLLAGDLYDGDQTSMKTARFLAGQLGKLHQAGISTFIIRGNHDALSKITRELTFPDSVHLFDGRGMPRTIDRAHGDMPVTIHGLSFAKPLAPESLLSKYRPPVDGSVNIGLMHTSLGGAPGHDPYAPCSIADLEGHGFDYWALGHIHKRSVIHRDRAVVMPGMPQGRDINESGGKSVTLGTITDGRSIVLEERLTSVAQFERTTIDLTGVTGWREAVTALLRGLQTVRDAVQAEHVVVRPKITGTTPLAWRVRRDRDLLLEQADMTFTSERTWIDKIEVECHTPGTTAATTADPISELRRLITQEVTASPAYRNEVAGIAKELAGQIPAEIRSFLGNDEAAFESLLDRLIAEGAEDVLSRLHTPEDDA